MVSPNRITHDNPELRDVLLEFLDSASSLCDMMNTTMAAVLNEIMSIQAEQACEQPKRLPQPQARHHGRHA